jgi:hypothetical protein
MRIFSFARGGRSVGERPSAYHCFKHIRCVAPQADGSTVD